MGDDISSSLSVAPSGCETRSGSVIGMNSVIWRLSGSEILCDSVEHPRVLLVDDGKRTVPLLDE